MTPLEKVAQLDRLVTQLDRDEARTEGQLEADLKRLREEFGCKDEKAAQKLLRKLEGDEIELEEQLDKKVRAFERDWKDQLENT